MRAAGWPRDRAHDRDDARPLPRCSKPLGEGGMGRVYLAEDPALGREGRDQGAAARRARPIRRGGRGCCTRRGPPRRSTTRTSSPCTTSARRTARCSSRWSGSRARRCATGRARAALPAELLAHRAPGGARARRRARGRPRPPRLEAREPDGARRRPAQDPRLRPRPQRRRRDDDRATRSRLPGTVLGTAPYMSPEQVLGQPAGPASDVFSLGTLLYELLTGRHPFAAASGVETMHRDPARDAAAGRRRSCRDFPARSTSCSPKALAKDPARRYANGARARRRPRGLRVGARAARPPRRPAASEGGGPRAIAVLPFKNIGGNADLDYLGARPRRRGDHAALVLARPRRARHLVGRALRRTQAVDPARRRARARRLGRARRVVPARGRALPRHRAPGRGSPAARRCGRARSTSSSRTSSRCRTRSRTASRTR